MSSENNLSALSLIGRQGLYNITSKSALSLRQTRKLIESLDVIYGFDLAQVILLISKNHISGYLNIISEKNEIYGVSFSDGNIVQIDNRDDKTFIGQLLINDGYITESELKELLKNTSVRIGQELINTKKMTKEQLIAVLLKQTILRLTQLINSKSIQISYTHVDVESSDIKITYAQLVDISFDWVFSCMTDQWLNMHYYEYKNTPLKIKSDALLNEYPSIYKKLTDANQKDFLQAFHSKNKIRLLEFEITPKILFRLIHQLILIDCIEFVTETKNLLLENDIANLASMLRKATPEQKLNSLALFTKCSATETDQIYEKLVEKLKTLKIDPDLKSNLLKTSMDFLFNPEQLKLARAGSEASDEAVLLIKNEAKDLIYRKEYFKAFTVLKKLNESQMKTSKIELFSLWCLIGHAIDSNAKIDENLLKNRLNKIRPEDRYEADYFYVLALYNKYLNKPNESQQYYNKSCVMNPKFKEFKIADKSFSDKLKSFFKFSILLLVCIGSQKAQSELKLSPIKFTNQYYQYNIIENQIQIAGLDIDFTNLEKTITEQNLISKESCFEKKTDNALLKICPPPRLAVKTPLTVVIAGTLAENTGTVILQDIKEYVELKVVQNNFDVIVFKTKRRAIAPYKIQKDANTSKTRFTFLDLNNRKNIWSAELGLTELTFKLESLTEPYTIFQDYVYPNSKIESEEIDFTMKLPTELRISYNRFGLNGLVGFSSFVTSTDTFNSTLNSAIGKGIKMIYERNLDSKTSAYTNIVLYSATISDDKNAVVILNKNFTLIDFNVGYKTYTDLNWAFSYEFNFRNYFSTKETVFGSNQYEIVQSSSSSLGITPEYTFLENRRWNLVTDISPSIIFPQSTPYGQSAIGYSWGIGLKTTYKLKSSRLYAGFNYADRSFNSPEAKYKNKDLIYAVGFYNLF